MELLLLLLFGCESVGVGPLLDQEGLLVGMYLCFIGKVLLVLLLLEVLLHLLAKVGGGPRWSLCGGPGGAGVGIVGGADAACG